MKNTMRKKVNGKLFATIMVMCACMIFSGTTKTYAWNNTKTRKAYSNYYGYTIGTLESRIWISKLSVNFAHTQITFDTKSSTWVFNAKKDITNHVNTLTLKKTGLTGSLSVSAGGAGLSVSEKTDSVCSVTTSPSTSYYRGINSYNNTITRGVVGTIASWTTPWISYLVVTGTSGQELFLDGQQFSNSATVSAYF